MIWSIPAVNVVAVIHLAFVAAFLGMYLCEAVVETYGYYKKEFSHSGIRCHYLIDLAVELPLIAGVIVTGITLTILVGKYSGLHLVLIACGSLTALFCPFCFFRWVRTRNSELGKEKPDEQYLTGKMREMIVVTSLVFQPALLVSLVLGVWLSYQRVLESIYGY